LKKRRCAESKKDKDPPSKIRLQALIDPEVSEELEEEWHRRQAAQASQGDTPQSFSAFINTILKEWLLEQRKR